MDSWIVSHRFVGIDDEVVGAGRRQTGRGASRRGSSGMRASSPSQSQPSPRRYSQPRPAGGASGAHGLEAPGLGVDRDRLHDRVHADPALGRDRAGEIRVVLVLDHGEARTRSRGPRPASRAGARSSPRAGPPCPPWAPRPGQLVRGGPCRLAVRRLVGQLDALGDSGGRGPRRRNCLVGERRPRRRRRARPWPRTRRSPSWTTRRPRPSSRSSAEVSRRPSRRLTTCERIRSMRASACSQPSARARSSTAARTASSGRAENSASSSSVAICDAPPRIGRQVCQPMSMTTKAPPTRNGCSIGAGTVWS